MVTLITGGAKGIGASLAKALVEKGHIVYLNYNTSIKEASLLKEELNDNLILVEGDLRKEENMLAILNKIKKEQNTLDLIINNACYYNDSLYSEKTKEDFMQVLEVNVVVPFLLMQKFSLMFDKGVVINLLSTDGIDTFNEYNYDYAASKAALYNLTQSMALSIKNLKIYGLVLNYVETESTLEMDEVYLKDELKRIGQNELISLKTVNKKVLELINDNYESGYIERVDNNE